MKSIVKFVLFFFAILYAGQLTAQKSFYSAGRKIHLQEDTTKMFVLVSPRNKDGRLSFGIENRTTIQVSPGAFISFEKGGANRLSALREFDADTNVLYSYHALTVGDGGKLIPTGEILLKLKPGVDLASLLTSLGLTGKVEISRNRELEMDIPESQRPSKRGQSMLVLTTEKDSVFNYANRIFESGRVIYSHPNFYALDYITSEAAVKKSLPTKSWPANFDVDDRAQIPFRRVVPNDPGWSDQAYYMSGVGDIDSVFLYLPLISLKPIVILDNGVALHNDLNFVGGYTPGSPGTIPGRPVSVDDYHGTACAGLAAAVKDNSIGIAGIAAGAPIYSVNINHSGVTIANIADGIHYAWNTNAPVISASIGFNNVTFPIWDAVYSEVDDAVTLGANGKGATFVASSGNHFSPTDPTSVYAPAKWPQVFPAGAVTPSNVLCSFSNVGPEMQFVATSDLSGILTTDIPGLDGASLNDYYYGFGGTSAACPQAAAAMLIWRSVDTSQGNITAPFVVLGNSIDIPPAGRDNNTGYGRIHAFKYLRAGMDTKATVKRTSLIGTNAAIYEMDVLDPFTPGTAGYTYNWTWSNPSIATIVYPFTGNRSIRLNKVSPSSSGTGTLTCSYGPVAGKWITKSRTVNVTALGVLIVANPNPASNMLTIRLQEEDGEDNNLTRAVATTASQRRQIKSIELLSATNTQRVFYKEIKGESYSEAINVSNLRNDLYILKISNGEEIVTKKIVIKH
ncbi:S8 family serine peptidase [Chitinophaga sp. CF418]|uniref:S8 family serine peptidase n=1 Tax=Chitinophaga sp. CF418 TaxID=1855287 RepID=UPI00091AC361|nr:S8 family serine peptidase [Chitinophaga sp. CF418]SHN42205.1 Subtilase family protein [Chitinophaga sp. CF418]